MNEGYTTMHGQRIIETINRVYELERRKYFLDVHTLGDPALYNEISSNVWCILHIQRCVYFTKNTFVIFVFIGVISMFCYWYLVKYWKEMCFTLKIIFNVRDDFVGPVYSRTCRVHCVVTESAASNQSYTTMKCNQQQPIKSNIKLKLFFVHFWENNRVRHTRHGPG
jgi:hypothetical protein